MGRPRSGVADNNDRFEYLRLVGNVGFSFDDLEPFLLSYRSARLHFGLGAAGWLCTNLADRVKTPAAARTTAVPIRLDVLSEFSEPGNSVCEDLLNAGRSTTSRN